MIRKDHPAIMRIRSHGRKHLIRFITDHLLLAEFAYEDFKLDEIWFLPNGNPPHKKTDESKKALAHRIKMIELAISDMPHFKIDLSEAETDVHSYTYSTMQKFNRMYPECEFYFILGCRFTLCNRRVEIF